MPTRFAGYKTSSLFLILVFFEETLSPCAEPMPLFRNFPLRGLRAGVDFSIVK
jgi:hypothetical protein